MRAGKLIAAVATLACWAGMPSAAHALPVAVPEVAAEIEQVESTVTPPVSHIVASSSSGRMSSERVAHGPRHPGATRPSSERSAPAHRPAAGARPTPFAQNAPAATAGDTAPLTSVPGSGASAGGSAGLFFFGGGGFALLVASLLIAGPHLRRRLSLLSAVCRPAAFLVVLERPG
jgi:hypothetical protein